MTNKAFGIQAIEANGTTLAGIETSTYDPRLEELAEASSGSLHQTAHHFLRGAPMCSVTSKDLQVMATLLSGNPDAPSVALTAFNMYAAEQSEAAPGYLATSSHSKWAATSGHLFLDSITWDGALASFDLSAFFIGATSATDPVTETTNNPLPTQDVFNEGYSLTSLTVGGAAITNLDSLSITVNHGAENNNAATCFETGNPYPVAMAMPGAHGPIEVVCEISCQDVSVSPSTGDVVATFTERADGGFLGADTVIVTINGTIEPTLGAGGSAQSPMSRGLTCRGFYDGTNKPITITP